VSYDGFLDDGDGGLQIDLQGEALASAVGGGLGSIMLGAT